MGRNSANSIWLGWSKLLPHNYKAHRKCDALGSAIPSAGSSDVRAVFVFFGLTSSRHSCSRFGGPLRFLSHVPSFLQAIRGLGWSKIVPKSVFTLKMKKAVHKAVNVMGTSHLQNGPSWDFPGGPLGKNPPPNAGYPGLIPGQGTKIPHTAGQCTSPCATTKIPLYRN